MIAAARSATKVNYRKLPATANLIVYMIKLCMFFSKCRARLTPEALVFRSLALVIVLCYAFEIKRKQKQALKIIKQRLSEAAASASAAVNNAQRK